MSSVSAEIICASINGWIVRSVCVSFEVEVTLAASPHSSSAQGVLSLTGALSLQDERGRVHLDVGDRKEALAPLLRTIGSVVSQCVVSADGALRIECAGGLSVGVPADKTYEAWRLRTPIGYLVVQPGGAVSVWATDDL